MDAAARSVVNSQAQLKHQVAVKLLGMTKDQMEQTGRNLQMLMESTEVNSSAHPYKGQQIDFRA